MKKIFWNLTTAIYKFLGPKKAWMIVMSPLAVYILKTIVSLVGKKKIVFTTKYGIKVYLRIEDILFGGYLHLGGANPYEIGVLRTILNDGDIFIDVGSHLGWYSLNASQVVGSTGKVFAFDPNPTVANWFRYNCKLNKLENVFLAEMAVSDKNGKAHFYVGDSDVLGSLNEQNASRESMTKVQKITVKMQTLDSFARQKKLKQIRFIKIDAEGADLDVLKGSKDILSKYHPYLLVEVYGLTWETDTKRDKNILSYLAKYGYKPYELTESGIKHYDPSKGQSQLINLFFATDEVELRKLHLLSS